MSTFECGQLQSHNVNIQYSHNVNIQYYINMRIHNTVETTWKNISCGM